MKKLNKTEKTSGVAIKLYDGKADVLPDFKTEAKILGQLDHPNIVRLYEVAKIGSRSSLVLELCTGGPILNRLPFKEPDVSNIMRQIMSAVTYMHTKNIVHRDIECSNIMFRTENEKSDIKLIDFGSATELELIPDHPGAFKYLKEKTGSLHIMAPEVIKQRYGAKADVWSCGVVAYTLLHGGKHPFLGASPYVSLFWFVYMTRDSNKNPSYRFTESLSLFPHVYSVFFFFFSFFVVVSCSSTIKGPKRRIRSDRERLIIVDGNFLLLQRNSSKQRPWSMQHFV